MFDQVRRNFEFGPNRAPFYLPANTSSKVDVSSLLNDAAYFFTDSSEVEVVRRCEAVDSPFSMASVLSYGCVTSQAQEVCSTTAFQLCPPLHWFVLHRWNRQLTIRSISFMATIVSGSIAMHPASPSTRWDLARQGDEAFTRSAIVIR